LGFLSEALAASGSQTSMRSDVVVELLPLGQPRPVGMAEHSQTFATGQPAEIREIAVEGTAVVITYESAHATGIVDLLLVAGH